MRLAGLEIGVSIRAADGFAGAGDAVVARACGERVLLAVIDVLGHGPAAHAVAARVEELLERTMVADPGALAKLLHEELGGTVGAAAGIAAIEPGTGNGRFVGVGNTVARVFGSGERRLVSTDGVLGQRQPNVRPVEFRLAVGEALVMHSDGVTSRFRVEDYPVLMCDDVGMVARELIRRFGRSHDDAACLAARRIA